MFASTKNRIKKSETETHSLTGSMKRGSFSSLMSKMAVKKEAKAPERDDHNLSQMQANKKQKCYLNTSLSINKEFQVSIVPSTSKDSNINKNTRASNPVRHCAQKKCEMTLFKDCKVELNNDENRYLKIANEIKERINSTDGNEAKYRIYISYFSQVASLSPQLTAPMNEIKKGIEAYIAHINSESSYQIEKANKLCNCLTAKIQEIEKEKASMIKEISHLQKKIQLSNSKAEINKKAYDSAIESHIKQNHLLNTQLIKVKDEMQKMKATLHFGSKNDKWFKQETSINIEDSGTSMLTQETKSTAPAKSKVMVPILDFSKLRRKNEELKLIIKPTKHISCESDSIDEDEFNNTDILEAKYKNAVAKSNARTNGYVNDMAKMDEFSSSWKELLLSDKL